MERATTVAHAYDKKRESLENQMELDLQELEKEIGEEEGAERIKQVQKKIQDS